MTTKDIVNDLWDLLYKGDPAAAGALSAKDGDLYNALCRHPLCRKSHVPCFRQEAWTDMRDRWIIALAGNLQRMPPAAMSEPDVDLLLACTNHPAVQDRLDRAMGEKKASEPTFSQAEKVRLKQLGIIGVPQWEVSYVHGHPYIAAEVVAAKLQEGWEPIGGPVSTQGNEMFLYFKRQKP